MTHSARTRYLLRMVTATGLVTLTLLSSALKLTVADDKAAQAAPAKAEHLGRMLKVAQSLNVSELTAEKPRTAKLIENPVLAYRDDTRKTNDSTVWIAGREGRPSAIIVVEHYPNHTPDKQWLYEIASLSAGRIAVERGSQLHWQARQAGLNLQALSGAPAPADKATARLAQMRQLRRRFTAHEREGTEGRIELQPLAAPLHRYQDPQHGIIDGAIFAFANGTNPEVLWIIEAHGQSPAEATWKFATVQITGAEVFAHLDGKEVWTRRDAYPPAERDSYKNGWIADEAVEKK